MRNHFTNRGILSLDGPCCENSSPRYAQVPERGPCHASNGTAARAEQGSEHSTDSAPLREVFAGALESGSPDQERRQVLVQAFPGRELIGEVAEAARDLAERFLELDLPRAEPGEKRFKQGPGGSRTT